ncbi:hypothetical protein [uncultured Gammaproteobacteria bacterium]|nr:hypothetical protein [uncultured Gammaproteobacteria bacterium]CAC9648825.1 hypothetical protein [uncultured Gammaproteobacteria bacterium]VVH61665.1 hypothetical protein BSPWISOX_1721 [uncultured Gammaproteobacteria bacterium]
MLKSIGVGAIISPNLSLIASPLPITKNAFSGLLSLPLTHNPNSVSELPYLK